MNVGDFLRKDAETPLCEYYLVAGAACSFSTNCEQLLEAARSSFVPAEEPPIAPDLTVRFWVDRNDKTQPPWPKPYVRGLDHLVFAGFDSGSTMLADLRTGHVIGRFSAGVASDTRYWKTGIFPILLTIVSASLGIAELHCACVARDQDGLLLAGPSGSGKSTLALALSQIGFGFLSDDRTFCSLDNREVLAWGLPTRIKLRQPAAVWFQELRIQQEGAPQRDSDLWLEPEIIGLHSVRRCQPRALVLLERQQNSQFHLCHLSSIQALHLLSRDLMAESPEYAAKQSDTMAKVVDLPCWVLKYGGQPQPIAQQISSHLEEIMIRRPSQAKSGKRLRPSKAALV
jgi:hypothetical protein